MEIALILNERTEKSTKQSHKNECKHRRQRKSERECIGSIAIKNAKKAFDFIYWTNAVIAAFFARLPHFLFAAFAIGICPFVGFSFLSNE